MGMSSILIVGSQQVISKMGISGRGSIRDMKVKHQKKLLRV